MACGMTVAASVQFEEKPYIGRPFSTRLFTCSSYVGESALNDFHCNTVPPCSYPSRSFTWRLINQGILFVFVLQFQCLRQIKGLKAEISRTGWGYATRPNTTLLHKFTCHLSNGLHKPGVKQFNGSMVPSSNKQVPTSTIFYN